MAALLLSCPPPPSPSLSFSLYAPRHVSPSSRLAFWLSSSSGLAHIGRLPPPLKRSFLFTPSWLDVNLPLKYSPSDRACVFAAKDMPASGDMNGSLINVLEPNVHVVSHAEAPTISHANMPDVSSGGVDYVLDSVNVHTKYSKNRFLLLAKLGTTIKKRVEAFFRSEIRQRAFVTLMMLIAVRAGHFVPLPSFDRRFMSGGDYLAYTPGTAIEEPGEFLSEMRLSLFQLGIGPYMGASIMMQVLCHIVPHFVRLRKEGSEGVKRIKQYTERLAFGLAVIQAFVIAVQSLSYSVYAAQNRYLYLFSTTGLMSIGAVLINWICNKITDAGFGQGPSLFICVNILTGYADSLYKVVSSLIYGGGNWGPALVALCGFSFCFTVCAVLTSAGHRKVKLQYYNFELASSAGAGGSLTEVEPYIPFNINPTGMQPLLATTILMSLPVFFARIFKNAFWATLRDALAPGSSAFNPFVYHSVTICLIFLFNILDLGNLPVEVNQYLMKIGARIPNVKPGRQTVEYLSKVQASTRFWGGLMLSLLVTTSTLVDDKFRHLHQGDTIGFTSMLIIVGAILDLRRTFLAYNVMPSLGKVLKRMEA